MQQIKYDKLAKLNIEQRMQFFHASLGEKLVLVSSLSSNSMVILHTIHKLSLNIPIISIDTGYLFNETLEMKNKIFEKYSIKIDFISQNPEPEVRHDLATSPPMYINNPDECCQKRKFLPLKHKLREYEAWITGIRRDQSPTRAHTKIIDWDEQFGLYKICPLADWTKEEVWAYIKENNIPYNPLHDQGYQSIGCWPCTKKTENPLDERSGRWARTTKTECGLHYPIKTE